jgi:ABC-type uncharacterized transport system permease subunit
VADLLVWPALLAYSEAAVAYVGVLRRPELATRLAIWGVRLGWLAHTALLGAQALRADGFAWSSSSGLLSLFVWLAVGCYLIWGCSPRFRFLGLAVMPAVAALFAVAALAGSSYDVAADAFVAAHVALLVAGFAGFGIAAALAGVYLWQERRLRLRAADVLRAAPPPLLTLDVLAARTAAAGLLLLSAGIALGLARVHHVDLAVLGALAAWVVYGSAFALRRTLGWRGRRFAYALLAGFALVVVLGLPLGHVG